MAVQGKKKQDFVSSIYLGSGEESAVHCQPCNRDGSEFVAYGYCVDCREYLCESCFNHHKKHTLSKHHTLLDKESMKNTQQLSSPPVSSSLRPDMAVHGQMARGFSTSILLSSDDDTKVVCKPCDKEGLELVAYGYCIDCKELLCEYCFKQHMRNSSSARHTLLDIKTIPRSLMSSKLAPSSTPDNKSRHCVQHRKELIKFYCHYHKALICSNCVTSEHTRSSCKVDKISNISGQVIDSKEFKDILKGTETIMGRCQKSVDDMKEMTEESNNSLTDVMKDVKNLRQELDQRLDELERQLEDAAMVIQQHNNKNLNTIETICGDVTKSMKTSSDSLKHLNASNQRDRLFMEMKFAEQMITYFEKNIQQLMEYNVKGYIFKPNEEISDLLNEDYSLGTLRKQTLKQVTVEEVELKPRKASYQCEIPVKTSKDKFKCRITGMCLLHPDRLVITDFDNMAIKMIGIYSHSVTDQLQLCTNPHDITSVTSTTLAATLPNKKAIQFISASQNKLTVISSLKVDGYCFGISYYSEKLVVSYVSPGKLQILDVNGTVLITIREEYVFGSLQYVAASQNGIFVCDNMMKTVASLNWQGDLTGVYKSVGMPQGVALSDDGTVYVCDKLQCILEEISSDCSKGNVVMDALKNPRAVCWCSGQRLLYFSCSTEKGCDNYLQIYKLS